MCVYYLLLLLLDAVVRLLSLFENINKTKREKEKKKYGLIVRVCYLVKHVLSALQQHNLADMYTVHAKMLSVLV